MVGHRCHSRHPGEARCLEPYREATISLSVPRGVAKAAGSRRKRRSTPE
jgi:hypothetical protein